MRQPNSTENKSTVQPMNVAPLKIRTGVRAGQAFDEQAPAPRPQSGCSPWDPRCRSANSAMGDEE